MCKSACSKLVVHSMIRAWVKLNNKTSYRHRVDPAGIPHYQRRVCFSSWSGGNGGCSNAESSPEFVSVFPELNLMKEWKDEQGKFRVYVKSRSKSGSRLGRGRRESHVHCQGQGQIKDQTHGQSQGQTHGLSIGQGPGQDES